MSKIRIYELARELGVDNKVVLTKAIELGLSEKTSHSNSLEADEADQIRRAVIRQAIGAPSTSEVVTKRVDRSTGTTDMLVERRMGNVIRRRRTSGDDAADEPASGVSSMEGNAAVSTPLPEGVEAAEALFRRDSAETEESRGADEEAETTEQSAETAGEQAQSDSSAQTAASGEGDAAEADQSSDAATTKAGTVGPRVLGRIDLPQKKAVRPEPAKRSGASVVLAPPVVVSDEEEEDGAKRGDKKKRTRKREISRIDLVDYEGRDFRRTGRPGARSSARGRDDGMDKKQSLEATRTKASKRVVKMAETVTVGDLAKQMSLKAGDVITKLMELGILATINQAIDLDTATLIAEEFEFQVESTGFDETEIIHEEIADGPENVKARPPIVTVMGHVDHGKTSLLDAIRKSSVAAREHGGITQHIGAYGVQLENGKQVTFIDTPGHAAFTSMRARGAKVTDIVVLVVAADDGVMPQTIEALNHAKAAEVSIVVAVNKIDKPDAKPERVKQQLAEHGLQPEEWGGDVMFFPVSATTGQGIKELLEGLLLLAEVKELRANPDRRALGTIIESKQDRGRGTVATVLVQNGTLRIGDIFVTGAESGRVRSMLSADGTRLEEVGPSTPVEITGLTGMAEAGDDFFVVESEASAREVAENRRQRVLAAERLTGGSAISLEEFARRANNEAAAELNIILKCDVAGSVGAVQEAMEKLSTPKVKVRVIHTAVGGVSESDVQLAIASKAIIIGFGVRAEPRAMSDAEQAGIQIRFYRVIYELIDDVKKAMVGLLAPVRQEYALGRIEVRETFNAPKIGTIAGCYVVDGLVRRGAFLRLLRDSRVVHEGKLSSLRRFKDDVREVQSGYECGVAIEGYNDVKAGDVMEVYDFKEVQATLE